MLLPAVSICCLASLMKPTNRHLNLGYFITIGVSIIIAKLLGLGIPIDPEIVQVITMVALIVGIALL